MDMKRICSLIILMLCLVVLPAFAADEPKELGFWFEAQAAGNTKPWKFTTLYEPPTKGRFGFFVTADQWSDEYRVAYTGPTFKVTEWLKVGIGIGGEQTTPEEGAHQYFRCAMTLEVNLGKISAFGTFENGGTGPWHRVSAVYKISEKIGVGGMSETDIGIGPRVEYRIAKNFQIWGALLRDPTETSYTPILAINYSF